MWGGGRVREEGCAPRESDTRGVINDTKRGTNTRRSWDERGKLKLEIKKRMD